MLIFVLGCSTPLKEQHAFWTVPFKNRQMFRLFCEPRTVTLASEVVYQILNDEYYKDENLLWCPRMGKAHSSMEQTKIPQLSRNTLNTNLMQGHRDSSVSPYNLPEITEHRIFIILFYCEQSG